MGQLIIACLRNFPPLWCAAHPRGGCSVGGPVIICPLFWRAARAGQLFVAFLPDPPPPPPEQASLSFAFLLNLPPFWRTARAGLLINALLLFKERDLSRPAYHLRTRAGQFVICPYACFAVVPDQCEKHSVGGGGGGTLYYSKKGCSFSRTKGNGYWVTAPGFYTRALPPNAQALRTF